MSHPRTLALASALTLCLISGAASAQMGQGPPTPLAMDLSKVAAGSWASYAMTMGAMPPMSMRMALVGKAAGSNKLEMSVEGGMTASVGKVITQVTVPAGKNWDGHVQKVVLQVGGNDPMEMPVSGAQAQQFAKPDPKTLVKAETLKVAAGSFKTKHYRNKTPGGDTVDFWVAENAAPIGLVKMEMDQKNNPMIRGTIKMELSGLGKDAKPNITKPAKPFDEATLMKEMNVGGGGPPPAGK